MENRVIKFRAWCGEYMHEVASFDSSRTPAFYFKKLMDFSEDGVPHVGNTFNRNTHPNFVLMQFTGLFDKNGKEIYEGDIIGYVTASGFSTTKENGCVEKVEFSGGGFRPFAIPGWEVNPPPEEIEVIGNVYENPELLPF